MVDLFGDLVPATKTRRVSEPIVRSALIEGNCRLWLKRAWGAGPMILWAGANPSKADGLCDDPTMWRVMEFSARWGYGSCIMVNPIPFISSTPTEALAWVKRAEEWMIEGDLPTPEWKQWQRNITEVSRAMDTASAFVAAWGNIVPPDLIRRWLQDLAEATDPDWEEGDDRKCVEWICLGKTISGAPIHPLARGVHRVPDDAKPVAWKMKL